VEDKLTLTIMLTHQTPVISTLTVMTVQIPTTTTIKISKKTAKTNNNKIIVFHQNNQKKLQVEIFHN